MNPNELMGLLKSVEKPAQYLGNEVNAIHKDFDQQKVRVCLIFPDAYEMGMSHMGQKILYDILNNVEGVVAERCFAPLPDFENVLREKNVPLFSLESKRALSEFDIIAISVPYELTYTNMLNILDLGQIPVWQKDRKDGDPIVITGGTGSYNPEPYADFVDAVGIGDGEEMILEVVDRVIAAKDEKKRRQVLLNDLSEIEGVYVPSFFEPVYNSDGTLKEVKALKEGYTGVKKRIVKNLDDQSYPTNLIVPNIKLIHDRIGIEIQRGCTRMCRFCQAGYIERPTRQRSPENVLRIAKESYDKTGIDEISLLSLSAGDYQTIVPTLKELNKMCTANNISLSVPATRTETLTPELIEQVKKVRKTGFTIAPEAGSERMRMVINKGNKVENLMKACRNAFSAGYELIKFYYLCGLPFERDEDLLGMTEETFEALQIGREYTNRARINVSVSSLVPKPFTPFQWIGQKTQEENERRLNLVKHNLKDRKLKFKCHDSRMSWIEGIFSRGDRRLSQLLFKAFENGCRFDEWREHLRYDLWEKSFEETNTNPEFYVTRERSQDEALPWDHLFIQMKKDWLWNEFEAARNAAYVADCSIEKCAQFCGVCDFKEVKNKIYVVDDQKLAAKKGNREWYGRYGEDSESPRYDQVQTEKSVVTFDDQKKLRVFFAKRDWAALIGHLELMGHLKRAISRTDAQPAYSQGFHPQMKLSMGYALPLGLESECESFDLVVKNSFEVEKFCQDLKQALPDGLVILSAEWIDLRTPSLYSKTQTMSYEVEFFDPILATKWQAGLQRFYNGESFLYTRQKKKGKTKDFQIADFLIEAKQVSETVWNLTLRIKEEGSLKPIEVIAGLMGTDIRELNNLRLKKTKMSFEKKQAA